MAALTFALPTGRVAERLFYQKAAQSSDASSSDLVLVPQLADATAVIDKVSLNFSATETIDIKTSGGELIKAMKLSADTIHELSDIKADGANKAISLSAASSADVSAYVLYHYE